MAFGSFLDKSKNAAEKATADASKKAA